MASLALALYVPPLIPLEFIKQQVDKHAAELINRMPDPLLFRIFDCLSAAALTSAALVCKRWSQVVLNPRLQPSTCKVDDLRTRFPLLKHIFDKRMWEEYIKLEDFGVHFDGVKSIDPQAAIRGMRNLCLAPIEADAGFSIVTMPNHLTLNKLISMREYLKTGNVPVIRKIWRRIIEKLGDTPFQGGAFIISNAPIQETMGLPRADHLEIINYFGGELPGVGDVVTLIFLRYITSPNSERLYPDNPRMHTRCLELVGLSSIFVGGFTEKGLRVDNGQDYEGLGLGIMFNL